MIRLEKLHLSLGSCQLRGIDLELQRGSLNILLGRSGCGKTTLLEALCGLRPIDSGRIWCDGEEITGLPPSRRRLGYVPQDLALFQALSPRQNLVFALEIAGWTKAAIASRVEELCRPLKLEELIGRPSLQGFSGGERQRLALGRALALRPRLLLLDEPFAALDPELRQELGEMLRQLVREEQVTILMVTHSRAEAEVLGDSHWRLDQGVLKSGLA
ncbi:MAG: hypothetical protein RL095_1681 [Verrucomicrobiota bacterium]|jgi:ABC-type sugar transport system ATPase subunit